MLVVPAAVTFLIIENSTLATERASYAPVVFELPPQELLSHLEAALKFWLIGKRSNLIGLLLFQS